MLDIEGAHQASENKKKTWYDFVYKKEHHFIRNIYSREELFSMDNTSDISDYYEQFGDFIKILIQLEKRLCNSRMGKSPILEGFLYYNLNGEFFHYWEIRDAIDEFKVVKKYGKSEYIDKIIGFVYANVMKLKTTKKVKGPIFSLNLSIT